jgi:hypothetical protein
VIFIKFELAKKSWKKVSCRGKPPQSRWGAAMSYTPDRKMVVFGGCTDGINYNDVFEFSFGTTLSYF